jgi:hypothetical protein
MALPAPAVRWLAFATAGLLTFLVVVAALRDEGELPPEVREALQEAGPQPYVRDLSPYDGLGTWVDAFDYGRAYQTEGHQPAVGPADVEAMHDAGVRTIFLQVTRVDERSPDGFVDRELAADILHEAHARGMAVVGWYLPTFSSPTTDVEMVEELLDFEDDGHRLDGVGLDIEYTEAVPDHAVRNRRLVHLSERVDQVAGDTPVSAIVLPAVQIEVINPALWPDFPWADLARHYDVWLPMSYWTFRTEDSGFNDGARYHRESVERMVANLGHDESVVVHGIGGIGDLATGEDLLAFARTLAADGAIGGSVYDWATLSETNRALLARLFEAFPEVPG